MGGGLNSLFASWMARAGGYETRVFRWRGNGAGTKTNWKDGRNWVNLAGSAYAEAVYPGTGQVDCVWFDAVLATGASSVTTGTDLSAAYPLQAVIAADDYDGAIGSLANPLICDMLSNGIAEVLLDLRSDNSAWLKGSGTNGLSRVLTMGTKSPIWLAGKLGAVYVMGGYDVEYDATVTACTSLHIGRVSSRSDVIMDIEAGAVIPATVTATGGKVWCDVAVTTLKVCDAIWRQEAGNVTDLLLTRGTFYWGAAEPTTTIPGNVGTADVQGGTFDGSDNMQQRTVTLLRVHKDATANLANGEGNIGITQFDYRGGTLVLDRGQRLTAYS